MIRARVEYDKYNRTFRLLDREFASTLEDGVEYELVVPFTVAGLDEGGCAVIGGAGEATDEKG